MRHVCAALVLGLALVGTIAQAQTPSVCRVAGPSFKALDANHDGRLSLDEVLAYAKKKCAEVQPFRIADVDLDGDGRLTPEELKQAGIKGLEQFGTIDVKELDIRGDGYISREDLDEYFRRKHQEAFVRADANRDGTLTRREFALFRF